MRSVAVVQDYAGREKRRSPRALTFKTGRIVSLASDLEMLAAVLDISEGGACLLVPDIRQVPDRFQFFVDGKPATLCCAVRWKSGHKVGVRFL
jgi:hypothetical protein